MRAMVWSGMTPEEQALEIARLDYEDFRAESADRLKIQEGLGTTALRSLILINGGAIIALFTFLGSAGSKAAAMDGRAAWFAFAWFVAGLASVVASTGAAYLMQMYAYHSTVEQMWAAQSRSMGGDRQADIGRTHKLTTIFERATIALAAVSLLAFCVGSGVALDGLIAAK